MSWRMGWVVDGRGEKGGVRGHWGSRMCAYMLENAWKGKLTQAETSLDPRLDGLSAYFPCTLIAEVRIPSLERESCGKAARAWERLALLTTIH